MSAKHRMSESPKRDRRSPFTGVFGKVWSIAFGSMIVAAALAALLVNAAGPGHPPPPPADQHISQQGTLIAVSEESVTARSQDGIIRTYLVTPQTAVITRTGSQFAVNDEVDIIGTIRNGTALATAVAHRELGNGDGPPMDYVAVQPVNGVLGTD
ncbi:MAG: hypothetical protein CK429_00050 [Mycobacterium sp.]|jgi:hypothetical protein|uniref:DUF5666 domain-containing protein n=1 Tax=Mycobacterium gordonae TaxID=1778 RepID=A0A1A6BBK1_MYCGO|nr:hypothetical protein [Mycobacterium gordonae]MBI2698448.1 hypothetical protein [Mycobacterium sp.]MBX9978279.1 hypothetical protein [Mycobacterium gordonae]OBR99746.1 hypothetical protein A9W98_02305 [Mycobacterium gordonae]PJE08254.1 MAG: hypothetical protein CK428_20665 [Mycobacterium sp.]PJE19304.1 MAG: hypothetical protein CK429_00050 [Mycobacterium sp.]